MTPATIFTTSLLVRYERRTRPLVALEHPGLRIQGGSSVAVVGPSGSGKSTLLGLLAGLAVPTSGKVTMGDTVISELSEKHRARFRRSQVGMIYQSDNLLPHLTVEENVALPLAIAHCKGDTPGALLERLGMADLARRFPDQLSGGQRQRVAVARAIISRPRLILADEPTGALDDKNAAAVIDLLMFAHRSLGATIVFVTHDPAFAGQADQIVVLRRPADEAWSPRC